MSRMTMMMDFYVIMTLFAIVSLLIIGLLFGFVASPSALNKFFDFVLCSKENGKKKIQLISLWFQKMGLLVGHQDFSMLDLSTLPIWDLADDGVYGMDLEEGNAEEAIMSLLWLYWWAVLVLIVTFY